jgi:alpha-beta hydrolase superfamily lysophospholipase
VRIASALASALFCSAAAAGPVFDAVPPQPDPSQRYLIYLHGLAVENDGPNASSRAYGAADHHGVVKALADRGFTVIAELRPRGTSPRRYADRLTGQIEALRKGGVPAASIAIVGFSKGGMIALLAAAETRQPEIRYVVMAGCGIGVRAAAFSAAVSGMAALKGRMLSIYDRNDREGGSCREAFARGSEGFSGEETVLSVGSGHALFYRPDAAWIEPVIRWIGP